MSLLVITGRTPALSIAELESVFGADSLKIVSPEAIELHADTNDRYFDQLGGVTKVAKKLAVINTLNWNQITDKISAELMTIAGNSPDGKITLGLSVYGLKANPRQINGTALALKKVLKNSGRSVRVVPNSEPELNTAQVMHNKLTGQNGVEIVIIKSGNRTFIGKTIWSQDIDAYTKRDQARPMRDSRVGMLPPKLAQTIINLSGYDCGKTLLDPFCGTGVILQETLLMGGYAVGTDLEPRMIEYSEKNLEWLSTQHDTYNYELSVADATDHTWDTSFDVIACETYLGRPLTSLPDQETLNKIIQDCNTIHKKFLQNVARQTSPNFKMCIAVPAWKTKNGFKHLPVLDHLEELGYNRLSFVHVNSADLIYHRADQTVARELIVLTRK